MPIMADRGYSKTINQLISRIIFVLVFIILCSGCQAENIPTTPDVCEEERLFVHFIDVESGESIFIQTVEGQNMLIYTGEEVDFAKTVDYLSQFEINQLDIVVIPYSDVVSTGYIHKLLELYTVTHIFISGTNTGNNSLIAFQKNMTKLKWKKPSRVYRYLFQGLPLPLSHPLGTIMQTKKTIVR